MSDREIIQGLIDRDNHITEQFFYVKCRPLLTSIMRLVFNYPVSYAEMVNELYEYLIADNCSKLRQFQFRSSLYQWIKVVATRFFIQHRDRIIEDKTKDVDTNTESSKEVIETDHSVSSSMDIDNLLHLMDNQRYVETIRNLVLKDMEPEYYASQIGVTVANLYNIKKRAMTALAQIALKYYPHER